jgi:hypothetical protein
MLINELTQRTSQVSNLLTWTVTSNEAPWLYQLGSKHNTELSTVIDGSVTAPIRANLVIIKRDCVSASGHLLREDVVLSRSRSLAGPFEIPTIDDSSLDVPGKLVTSRVIPGSTPVVLSLPLGYNGDGRGGTLVEAELNFGVCPPAGTVPVVPRAAARVGIHPDIGQ